MNKKCKEVFLTALATAIKKDPTKSKRKHADELIVHEKTVRIAIKEDSSPDLYPLDYAIWERFRTNATFHPHVGSLKTAIEKEWY